jgi:hypothetical protein
MMLCSDVRDRLDDERLDLVDLTGVQWARHYSKTFPSRRCTGGFPESDNIYLIWWFRHHAPRRSVTIASQCDDVTMPRCCDNRFTSMLSFKIVFFDFFLFLKRFEINSNLNCKYLTLLYNCLRGNLSLFCNRPRVWGYPWGWTLSLSSNRRMAKRSLIWLQPFQTCSGSRHQNKPHRFLLFKCK